MTAVVGLLFYLVCFAAGFLTGLLVGAYRWRSGGRHRGHPTMRG